MAKTKEVVDTVVDTVEAQVKSLNSSLKKMYKDKSYFFSAEDVLDDGSRLTTGSVTLDTAIGIRLPPGIYEICGKFGVGKTTVALQIIANAQQKGWPTYYIDLERTLNVTSFRGVKGIDKSKLFILKPKRCDEACDMAVEIFRSVKHAVVVFDSISVASNTEERAAKGCDEHGMAVLSRLMGTFLNKVLQDVSDNGGRLILINQSRENLKNEYDTKGTTPGGNIVEHVCNARIHLKSNYNKTDHPIRAELSSDPKAKIVGKNVDFVIFKNRYNEPNTAGKISLKFANGSSIWNELEVFNKSVEMGIMDEGGGGTFSYKNYEIPRGKASVLKWLEENPAVVSELEEETYKLCSTDDPKNINETKNPSGA
jgi:recombination protein RecA